MLAVALFLGTLLGAATEHAAAQDRQPMVLVVEGAGGRLSVLRLRRALSSVLDRAIVRVTDEGAERATLRMTIAFATPRSWTLLIECGGSRSSRTLDIRGPALETLVGVAVDMVRSAEGGAPDATTATSTASPPPSGPLASPWTGAVAIASEILDPFAGMPISRVAIAAVSDLLDPFAAVGSSVRAARSPEVLDPWR